MRVKFLLLAFLITVVLPCTIHAQEISFKDSIAAYNRQRINTNKKGLEVLAAWGAANIAVGGIGYFTARQDEWKYFQGMNALWGAVNTGVAAIGLAHIRRETTRKPGYEQAYNSYLAGKKLYLINAALDVVYIGAGIGLAQYANTTKTNTALFRGFGRSIAMQGIFLLVFDNFMFAAQQRSHSKWYILMDELRITNNGAGINYTF